MDKDKIIEVMARQICVGILSEDADEMIAPAPGHEPIPRWEFWKSDANEMISALSEAGMVIMCQADVTSGGERSSPQAALHPGDGGEALVLHIERGRAGLLYVTSPTDGGLLVAGHSLGDALGRVPLALEELRQARLQAALEKLQHTPAPG